MEFICFFFLRFIGCIKRFEKRLKRLLVCVFCLTLVFTIVGCRSVDMGPGFGLAKRMAKNLIRVEAQGPGNKPQSGLGFYVGADDTYFYYASAAHIFAKCEKNSNNTCKSITAIACQSTSRYEAQVELVLNQFNNENDLAYLRVPKSFHSSDEVPYVNSILKTEKWDPIPGNIAWRFSRSRDCTPEPIVGRSFLSRGGRVEGFPSGQKEIEINNMGSIGGNSGSPIVTQNGMIGMLLGKRTGDIVYATDIYHLKKQWTANPQSVPAAGWDLRVLDEVEAQTEINANDLRIAQIVDWTLVWSIVGGVVVSALVCSQIDACTGDGGGSQSSSFTVQFPGL